MSSNNGALWGSSSSSRLRPEQEKKDQSACLFFLPAVNELIDGSGYTWRRPSRADSVRPALLSSCLFSFCLGQAAAGAACEVSSRVPIYKNNPGFFYWDCHRRLAGEVKWVIRHNSPLLARRTAPLYTVLTPYPHTHTH